jgi:hypothetical protein
MHLITSLSTELANRFFFTAVYYEAGCFSPTRRRGSTGLFIRSFQLWSVLANGHRQRIVHYSSDYDQQLEQKAAVSYLLDEIRPVSE